MAKKSQGRPKKKPGQGRDELLQVRLTPAEKQGFSEAAELCGQELSVWVRDVLRRAAGEEMRKRDKPNPF